MTAPVTEWGRRLSDAIRAALAAGDRAAARRLAAEGDGQARSLAKEYAFMYRGLGITIHVLLPLLRDCVARAPAAQRDETSAELVDLLRRFRADMAALIARTSGTRDGDERAGSVDDNVAATAGLLEAGEAEFDREQARLAEAVGQALDAGLVDRARVLLDDKEQGHYVPLHDRLIRFMAESFAWVLRRFGPAELLRFHLATAEGQRRGFEKWESMTAAELAWTTAFLLKQHMGQVSVREDAEKFTVEQTPCGSGGRLRITGAYEGPDALPFVEPAGPLTFGQPRLPVYCSHCPVWNAVAPLRWFGRPHWIFDHASRPDGSCTLHLYKRREDVPREYVAIHTLADDRSAKRGGEA